MAITKEQKAWGESLISCELKDYDLNIMKLTMTKNKFGQHNIELRVKPRTPDKTILAALQTRLAKLRPVRNDLSPNSGKYASLSFVRDGLMFDLIVADGANKGETFEKQLLEDLQAGKGRASQFIAAIKAANPSIKHIIRFGPGPSGAERKRMHLDPSQHGRAIADIVITTKCGGPYYASVKNSRGQTLANMGYVKAAFDGLSVRPMSDIGQLLTGLGVSLEKYHKGLIAYTKGRQVLFNHRPDVDVTIRKHSTGWKYLERAWGYNYIYVKESHDGFSAINIDKQRLHSSLISGLKVNRIHYPNRDSKQLSIHFGNKLVEYKLELRNPHGPGSIVPTDVKLIIKRSIV